jgi:hypothetical protein
MSDAGSRPRKIDAIREADVLGVQFPSGLIRWQVRTANRDTITLITPGGKDYKMSKDYLMELLRAGQVRRLTPIELAGSAPR